LELGIHKNAMTGVDPNFTKSFRRPLELLQGKNIFVRDPKTPGLPKNDYSALY
jgi:hypothetical protein